MPTVRDLFERVVIIAHREETSRLEAFLRTAEFSVTVQRRVYSEVEAGYSLQARCLLNHLDAWRTIAQLGKPTLVLEADFVPVASFASLPAPFDPERTPRGLAWLYAGGPVVYEIDEDGRAIGHSSTTVALAMTPAAASELVRFGESEITASGGRYTPWDTYLSHRLRRNMDVPTFVPFRQYGEHGGRSANDEHTRHGVRGWHQGDRLAGRLAFLPDYAGGSQLRFRWIRARANLRGLARLATGRYLERGAFGHSPQKLALLTFALRRWVWP